MFLGLDLSSSIRIQLVHILLRAVLLPIGFILLLLMAPANFLYRRARRWARLPRKLYRRTVLITGASSGIGKHLAFEYARHGANLVLVARRLEELERVARHCQRLGSFVECVQADIADEAQCRAAVEHAVNYFGALDTLVNNAGVAHSFFFEEAKSFSPMLPIMDVNLLGYAYMAYFALPHLSRRKGQMVVISSTVTALILPKFSIYNASKAAVTQFFDTLRVEPMAKDVSITLVMPGVIQSEMTAGRVYDEVGERRLDMKRRDAQFGPLPMMKSKDCAKRILDAARHDEHYVVVPFWYTSAFLYRFFVPEYLDRLTRVMLRPMSKKSPRPAAQLAMELMPRAREAFYEGEAVSEARVTTARGEDARLL